MKPFFVSMKEGQRAVHWPKLVAFGAVVLVLSTGLVEGLWWILTGSLSGGAVVVGLVIGTLIVVRAVARAVTYQEEELEMTVGST
jgi:hypothetical protein